eukprot:TRINITY_DN9791_c1_g2_i1.p1 TRINITY_DN9791_c1_g2~~TRINITY_DN9791_c1_g2_i1.p1  ORF type:complete len:748 (-),score=172.83 TRINITY_DN9791_c1_g2_i1:442-2685(-)
MGGICSNRYQVVAPAPNDSKNGNNITNSEPNNQAARKIQKWYRKKTNEKRMNVVQQRTWQIFNELENHNVKSKTMLVSFFKNILFVTEHAREPIIDETNATFNAQMVSNMKLDDSYTGPHLSNPIQFNDVVEMISSLKLGKILHPKYVLQLCLGVRELAMKDPPICTISTSFSRQLTVVGDIHGQFEDLLTIFYMNGFPSDENPYLFNGDFVDRGQKSVEVICTLFAFKLLFPNAVFFNRGNHEDTYLNMAYGFAKEVFTKYDDAQNTASMLLDLFGEIFDWLPLAHIVDRKVFIVHGGLTEPCCSLDHLTRLDRSIHKNLAQAETAEEHAAVFDNGVVDQNDELSLEVQRRIIQDLLWSDPSQNDGTSFNSNRQLGIFFGPDITHQFLDSNKLDYMIRSHEVKQDGLEITHDGRCITVFSASDYYGVGTNMGAFIKLDQSLIPSFFTYTASPSDMEIIPCAERVDLLADIAMQQLRDKIAEMYGDLKTAFAAEDKIGDGMLPFSKWAEVMNTTTQISVPWEDLYPALHDSIEAAKKEDAIASGEDTPTTPSTTNTTNNEVKIIEPTATAKNGQRELPSGLSLPIGKGGLATSEGTAGTGSELYDIENNNTQDIADLVNEVPLPTPIPGNVGHKVVNYMEFLDGVRVTLKRPLRKTSLFSSRQSVFDILYKHRKHLEDVFAFMDTDHSGDLSREEFYTGCTFLNRYLDEPVPAESVAEIFTSLDVDGDGSITINEFLECFRLTNSQG